MAKTRMSRETTPARRPEAARTVTDDRVRSALVELYLYEIKGVGEKPGFCGSP